MSRINRSIASRLMFNGFMTVILTLQGCYNGVGQSEIVEIKQVVYSPSNQVAMTVEEEPPGALAGYSYFVLVNDRPYTLPELRKSLFALNAVFEVGRDNFVINWSGPNELTITCHDCGITKDRIQTQKYTYNGVTIKYVDFP